MLEGKGYSQQVEENEVIRFCVGMEFNVEQSVAMLEKNYEWRRTLNVAALRADDVRADVEGGSFTVVGRDKKKRVWIAMRLRKFLPKRTTGERLQRFVSFILEEAVRQLPPHVDKDVSVSDFRDFSTSNIDVSQLKMMVPILSNYY